jgi:hypothetical protein
MMVRIFPYADVKAPYKSSGYCAATDWNSGLRYAAMRPPTSGGNAQCLFALTYKGGDVMFSLIRDLGLRLAMKQEAVPFLIAFAVAEFFFKFKSFALECLAFLAVWFLLSFLQSLVVGHDKGQKSKS